MKINLSWPLVQIAFIILTSFSGLKGQDSNTFFDRADQLFRQNVDAIGSVDYAGIKKDPKLLNQLYAEISSYDLKGKSAAFIKAFYTNTYNILVIKQVVDRYPIAGPLTVSGFFDNIEHTVAGEQLTLNQVEKDKNLYVTKDARLHFVLVCAAKSCPPLANFAFMPDTIEEQLDERTRMALNNEAFLWTTKKNVQISKIFEWYKDDFKNADVNGIVGYINKYKEKQIPGGKKLVYYEYNWALNEQ